MKRGKNIATNELLSVLNKFIVLAENTYEVEEEPATNEWHLKKKHGVYDTISKAISELTKGPCFVWAYYKEKDLFTFKAGTNESESLLSDDNTFDFFKNELDFPTIDWDTGILHDKSLLEISFISKIIQSHHLSDIVLFPLRSTKQAELVGLMACGFLESQDFDDTSVMILKSLSIQAALAVDHARLIERLSVLENIGANISKEADTLRVLRVILDNAIDLPRFSTGQLYLADVAQEYLYLVEWRNAEEEKPMENIQFNDGPLGIVAKDRKPIYIKDINNSSIINGRSNQKSGSLFAVPIMATDVLLGVLCLESTIIDAFTELDRYIINSFARLASVAIWGFMRMMEVAYIDLVLASENHVWGSIVVTLDMASSQLLKRLQDGKIDADTLRLSEILSECSSDGFRRITNVYNIFDQGRTLGSPLFHTNWRIESVSVDSVLRNILEEMQPRFGKYRIKSSFVCTSELTEVNGVLPMLQIAFSEIIQNSLEELVGLKSEKSISITMSSDANKDIIIEIIDNGRGIPSEDKQRLFEKRFSSKKEFGGIGLTIAKMVITQHSGSIKVKESDCPELEFPGCAFIICLPARKGNRP